MRHCGQSGFTLVETGIVCALGAILLAIAIPLLNTASTRADADSAAQLISQQLAYARALAVGTHAPVLVRVDSDSNTIVAGQGAALRGPFPLPGKLRLQTDAITPETPDNLNATVLGTGSHKQISFLDNGSAVDPATNNVVSGTFFIQHENGSPSTSRAVTLMGGTGRIHTWRYDPGSDSWK